MNVWVTLTPVAYVPSPKDQLTTYGAVPLRGSLEKLTGCPLSAVVIVARALRVGRAWTAMVRLAMVESPALSLVHTRTGYVPTPA